MKKMYPVIFTQTNDCVLVEVPDLEILTEGKDMETAIEMARDAISITIVSMEDNKEQVLSNTSNEDKSAFVSNLSNYVTIQKSLCDISERCNIDDIIKNNYNKEES